MGCYIWHPHILPSIPTLLECVATDEYGWSIAHGTEKFSTTLLADLGIKAGVKSWFIKPYRSCYYTDFLGLSDDWRDLWQIVWKIRIVLTDLVKTMPVFAEPYVVSEAMDESATFSDRLKEDSVVACLVVSDFDDDMNLQKVQNQILGDALKPLQQKYAVGMPTFHHLRALGHFEQLQINLGEFAGEFYASGADYAQRALELCRQQGGTTHFLARE